MIIQPLILLGLATAVESAQPVYNPKPAHFVMSCTDTHLSQLPPPPAWCIPLGTGYNVWEYVDSESSHIDDGDPIVLRGRCGVWECGQSPEETDGKCGFNLTSTECWSANGEVSLEIKWSLLARIGPEFDFGGELIGCESVSVNAGVEQTISHCMVADCEITRRVDTVRTRLKIHREVAEWDCLMPDGSILTVGTECGTRRAAGARIEKNIVREVGIGRERPREDCVPCGELCYMPALSTDRRIAWLSH